MPGCLLASPDSRDNRDSRSNNRDRLLPRRAVCVVLAGEVGCVEKIAAAATAAAAVKSVQAGWYVDFPLAAGPAPQQHIY